MRWLDDSTLALVMTEQRERVPVAIAHHDGCLDNAGPLHAGIDDIRLDAQ